VADRIHPALPLVVPARFRFREVRQIAPGFPIRGESWLDKQGGNTALVTIDTLDEWGGGTWLHLSVASLDRDPRWADIVAAKEALLGVDAVAVQLLPPRRFWLNYHRHCHHLFVRVDSETVPRPLYDQQGCDGSWPEDGVFPPRGSLVKETQHG
jgi:hypothetical protein